MKISQMISVVDSHTAGEPTRVVTGGISHIPGNDMRQKKEWMAKNRDYLRKMLMWEPRGHRDMFGAFVTGPTSDDADVGVIFMHCGGYLDMCGHGSIGVVTVLLETGIIKPETTAEKQKREITLDTPAGKVYSRANVDDGRVKNVTVRNVPSFYYASVKISLKSVRNLTVHIAYAGNYFALVECSSLATKIEPRAINKLIELGLEIKQTVNREIEIVHPVTRKKDKVDIVEIYEETSPPRNVVIFGPGQVDRSPCGTGTCAKMAMLHAHSKLHVGQPYRYRSILGTEICGRIVEETKVGDYKAIIPEITGRAYITGIQQFVIDDEDPFKHGFEILSS